MYPLSNCCCLDACVRNFLTLLMILGQVDLGVKWWRSYNSNPCKVYLGVSWLIFMIAIGLWFVLDSCTCECEGYFHFSPPLKFQTWFCKVYLEEGLFLSWRKELFKSCLWAFKTWNYFFLVLTIFLLNSWGGFIGRSSIGVELPEKANGQLLGLFWGV